MSKTIIGTLTASAAFALLPLTAATAQPPTSVNTALWGRPPGRWCQSLPSSARPTRCIRHLTPCATSKPGTPGEARHRGDGGRISRWELLVGVPAREGLKGAVTALVRAVLAAGTAMRPLAKS
jgi:hypothetical protein